MTGIEWTDRTWNPVTGCDRVSPGCAHCYARRLAPRLRAMGTAKYARARDGGPASGPAFGVTLHPDALAEPLRWRRPQRVFVCSMGDLFHEEVPDEFIAAVFGVMAATPRHTYQLLTKRPRRAAEWMRWLARQVRERDLDWSPQLVLEDEAVEFVPDLPAIGIIRPWPLPNVWLGVSVENRRFTWRADVLRQIPAAVRWISAEPLLGPLISRTACEHDARCAARADDCMCRAESPDGKRVIVGAEPWSLDLTGIDWLVVGGESGPRARPMQLQWARDLRDSARDAGTAVFMKQLGGARPGAALDDLPEDLRIREFPSIEFADAREDEWLDGWLCGWPPAATAEGADG